MPHSDRGVPKYSDAELIYRNSCPEPNSGCWLWLGSVNSWGYGRVGPQRSERQAHRLSYIAFKGPITGGLIVLHSCDIPCCVNPDHLRLGTHSDNVQDAISRNRHVSRSGEDHPVSKLTAAAAEHIRASQQSTNALAKKFGVSWKAIHFVRTGATWRQ